jgi:hypothetical protein
MELNPDSRSTTGTIDHGDCLMSRWPDGDPDALWNALADRDVFVMPPGISLTASDSMIDKALPAVPSGS